MKKTLILLTIAVVGIASYALFAQEQTGGMMHHQGGPGRGMMMGKPMMDMCPMHSMMCKSMVDKQMVITEDGDIIVLAGNKLFKYDDDLELEKEVELKIDMEQMQQKMQQMMEQCPMRRQMMQMQGGMMGQDASN